MVAGLIALVTVLNVAESFLSPGPVFESEVGAAFEKQFLGFQQPIVPDVDPLQQFEGREGRCAESVTKVRNSPPTAMPKRNPARAGLGVNARLR